MEDTAIPYELPEAENHSFFFIDQRVETRTEAKLHRHDAWELYYVVHGYGSRTAGDTCQPFTAGDVALIPPSMLHRWEYAPESADTDGRIRYLMAAFDHSLVKRCMEAFPEVRNRLAGIPFPTDALKFGPESSRIIRKLLSEMTGMDELERLSAMLRLLPTVFTSPDHTFAGRPMRIERDVRRMQQIAAYVMGALCPRHLLEGDRCGSGNEPFGVLFVFQTVQGNDLFAVRHAIPFEHGLRTAETFAEASVGDLLPGRVQRRSAFQPHVQKGETHVSQSVQERRIDKKPLTVLFSGEKPYLCIRKRLLPMEQDKRAAATLRLLKIMDELREKCPWDRKQTFETLRGNTIEETYELADAILDRNMEGIREELGDLMLHIVFYSKLGAEAGAFDYADMVDGLCDKLIYRHPHVYGDIHADTPDDVKRNWEALKLRKKNRRSGTLGGVPVSLPAMVKALRIGEKAAGAGFDWERREDVWAKVREETAEVETEMRRGDHEAMEGEFGDLFFALVNACRLYGVDPEAALERTNRKFIRRFTAMEETAAGQGRMLSDLTPDEQEALWQKAKQEER